MHRHEMLPEEDLEFGSFDVPCCRRLTCRDRTAEQVAGGSPERDGPGPLDERAAIPVASTVRHHDAQSLQTISTPHIAKSDPRFAPSSSPVRESGRAAVQRAAELGFLHKVNDGSVGGLYWTGSNLVRLSDNSRKQQMHRPAQVGRDVMTPFVVCGSEDLIDGSSWMARRPGTHPDPDVVAIMVDTVRPRVLCRSGRRIEISRNCFNGRGIAC